MSDMNNWRTALDHTRRAAFGRLSALLGASELTPAFWEEMESLLLQADLGPKLTQQIITMLQQKSGAEGIIRRAELNRALREFLGSQLGDSVSAAFTETPSVLLVAGVNGSGKTTSIAKLAHRYQRNGKRVLLAAADTFRAAASDQLEVWAGRLGIEVIAGAPGSDPGAVAHDAAQAALARNMDLLIVDTAGRQHTSYNLMEELKKVRRVLGRVVPGAPHHTWLVLDAATGQNALAQAAAFRDAAGADGVILTKLDGSSKGGFIFRIRSELGLPIHFVGLGEKIDDLAPFDPQAFLDGIFGR
ncbi:MAG: signal recognition particle-docking protein FtsY [Anaerolineales bacterium]|nr:signal recognition particle-docking protein FtsY [Anaerolineales bacterium]